MILLPILAFNTQPNAVSEIDNRMLTENPFSAEARENSEDLTEDIENYVNDRIGFRDDMILNYTLLNDKLFGKMVHPTYSYGKDGYVFAAGLTTAADTYSDFHEKFADMVKQAQDYCVQRGVPFVFVFEPVKPAVLPEYLPQGLNYSRAWVDRFFEALDQRGVRYVDNTETLRERTEQGEVVFNQKYDANHWNDLGAYYGVNAILEELQKDFPSLQTNDLQDFVVGEKLETSLPVSLFPIHEFVPAIDLQTHGLVNLTDRYADELELHPSYRAFGYYVNPEKAAAGAPRGLVFQGSYMNKFGYRYMSHALGENIFIHDYQNILNLPYYFGIFQPDCVVFEVAEYTFSKTYFSYDRMSALDWNPSLSEAARQYPAQDQSPLPEDQIFVQQGQTLTRIDWQTDEIYDYVWLVVDGVTYDMYSAESGYQTTVLADGFSQSQIQIVAASGETLTYLR